MTEQWKPTECGFYWTDTFYLDKRPVLAEIQSDSKGLLFAVCHGGYSSNCWATNVRVGQWQRVLPPTEAGWKRLA